MEERGQKPIAFLDSGIGGIPYLLWVRKNLPEERLIYLADHLYFPYGIRKAEEIQEIVLSQAEKLKKLEDPKLFVLACNSATVHALEKLRSIIDRPVVGVVPAIKPAAKESGSGNVGIWATKATVESDYMNGLIDQFAQNKKVFKHAETDLVAQVEEHLLDRTENEWDELLKNRIHLMEQQGVDRLVLGCTHFTHLDEVVHRVSGGKIKPVDSREGVGRQVQRLLRNENTLSLKKSGRDVFFTSLEREGDFYKRLADKYQMDYRGVLQ